MTSGESHADVLIVAGEASGDMHGARLVQAMRRQQPELHFAGIGGSELAAAGVQMLYDAAKLAVVGVTEVISHLGDILAARRTILQQMQRHRPELLILIDYPDFNLLLAARARKLGIPVFYYISPQVWAWRSGRVKKIGRLTDRIAVILPFEKDFYAARGVVVDFVGHPLVDRVHASQSREEFLRSLNIQISARTLVVGLLPGSRSREIRSLLPDFLAAARLLSAKQPDDFVFLLPRASTISRELLEEDGLAEAQDRLNIHTTSKNRYDLMAACDAVVTASGTVTLELALLGVPTVATYRVSPRTYRLGRLLIRNIQYFSLVNLIADRNIIPELLQDEVTPENIARHLQGILKNQTRRATMLEGLKQVTEKLGPPGCAKRAAAIALECMNTENLTSCN
jgi:lipid-A-disaccharide synthase